MKIPDTKSKLGLWVDQIINQHSVLVTSSTGPATLYFPPFTDGWQLARRNTSDAAEVHEHGLSQGPGRWTRTAECSKKFTTGTRRGGPPGAPVSPGQETVSEAQPRQGRTGGGNSWGAGLTQPGKGPLLTERLWGLSLGTQWPTRCLKPTLILSHLLQTPGAVSKRIILRPAHVS